MPKTRKTGRYIVLEGPQGTGKTTQISLLASALRAKGEHVRIFREPDSQTDLTARNIRTITQDPQFPLNTKTEVLLYNAARSQSLEVIRNARTQGVTCLVDRNYLTTLAIQYYGRGDIKDYDAINRIIRFAVGDMEPDLTIVLDAPVDILMLRTKGRGMGERFDNLQAELLGRIRDGYLQEVKLRSLPLVDGSQPEQDVHADILKIVTSGVSTKDHVPAIAAASGAAKPTTESDDSTPLVQKHQNGSYTITPAGEAMLAEAVTSTTDNVYAFTDKLSPITIAAAMARLSRRGDDMRVTILDEFIGKMGKDEKLLQRVISAYGDDSVQQLAGQHLVVENASILLTKKLEWGRLGAYLEQSTRYIYYDQKDTYGRYKYFVPEHFESELKEQYSAAMDQIFDLYSTMVRKLTAYVREHSSVPEAERDVAWQGATRAQACDAVRAVLPLATQSTVGMYLSGQALESLIMHLLADELPEAWETGQKMLTHARKVMPTFLERADKPDRGGARIAYMATTHKKMRTLTKQLMSPTKPVAQPASVRLTDYWPKNELDLVPDMLYEHTNLSLDELRAAAANFSYEEKVRVFTTYFGERLNRRHKPGRAFEKAHYSFELVCEYAVFKDLMRHRMVDDLEWQQLTPYYGFEIPLLVIDAGLNEEFEQCFDLSQKLYELILEAGYQLEAQYATLHGHNLRWKLTYNARQAFHLQELRTTPQGHPNYRKIAKLMHDEVANVHPLIASGMLFVNQDEDPELTRLAAERYTQFKLQQLG